MGQQVKRFGVQLNGKSGRVFGGPVTEGQTELMVGAEDVTDNAVLAVAEYVLRSYDGALEVEYADGTIYQIQVVKIGQPQADGTRYEVRPDGYVVGHIADPQSR